MADNQTKCQYVWVCKVKQVLDIHIQKLGFGFWLVYLKF